MVITSLTVKNFRSIKTADIEPGVFSIIVGPNNHGKTNLFEAIGWFFSGKGDLVKICHLGDPRRLVEVIIRFSGLKNSIANMAGEPNQKKLKAIFTSGEDEITLRRSSQDDGKARELLNPKSGQWENPIGRDTAWQDLLPRLEYVRSNIGLDEVAKYSATSPMGTILPGILESILEKDPDYEQFKVLFERNFGESPGGSKTGIRKRLDELGEEIKAYLKKQFPDTRKVEFVSEPPQLEELLKKTQTLITDSFKTTAGEKGEGMQRATMLAIIQVYRDFQAKEKLSKNTLLLIDEAELHLHPSAQRKLKSALMDITQNGDQVMLNTHSSVLFSEGSVSETVFSVSKKEDGVTDIEIVSERELAQIVFDLLGGAPIDILLPRNYVIVEGRTELNFLDRVIRRFYQDKFKFQILYAEGDLVQQARTYEALGKLFSPLHLNPVYKDKAVILCDAPNKENQAMYDQMKTHLPELVNSGRIFTLPVGSLEEYYPEPWQKTTQESLALSREEKVQLSIECGESITKEVFEKEMAVIFQTLEKADELSYKP